MSGSYEHMHSLCKENKK